MDTTQAVVRFNGLLYSATTAGNVTTLRRTAQRGRRIRVDLLDAEIVAGAVRGYSVRKGW